MNSVENILDMVATESIETSAHEVLTLKENYEYSVNDRLPDTWIYRSY